MLGGLGVQWTIKASAHSRVLHKSPSALGLTSVVLCFLLCERVHGHLKAQRKEYWIGVGVEVAYWILSRDHGFMKSLLHEDTCLMSNETV